MGTHIVQYNITTLDAVLRMRDWIIICCSFQHTNEDGTLVSRQLIWCGVEISLSCSLDTISIVTEVHCVGILCQYLLLSLISSLRIREIKFELYCSNPFLCLHYQQFDTRNLTHKSCTILCTYSEHILSQLLSYSRSATTATTCGSILCSAKHAKRVYTPMIIESFILSINKGTPEHRINLFIFYRCTILVKVFSEQHTICRIQFACLIRLMLTNINPSRRFTKEPK